MLLLAAAAAACSSSWVYLVNNVRSPSHSSRQCAAMENECGLPLPCRTVLWEWLQSICDRGFCFATAHCAPAGGTTCAFDLFWLTCCVKSVKRSWTLFQSTKSTSPSFCLAATIMLCKNQDNKWKSRKVPICPGSVKSFLVAGTAIRILWKSKHSRLLL